jgi:hypothetical protein
MLLCTFKMCGKVYEVILISYTTLHHWYHCITDLSTLVLLPLYTIIIAQRLPRARLIRPVLWKCCQRGPKHGHLLTAASTVQIRQPFCWKPSRSLSKRCCSVLFHPLPCLFLTRGDNQIREGNGEQGGIQFAFGA